MPAEMGIVVERPLGTGDALAAGVSIRDVVRLTAEQRERAHLRVRSERGRELVISLPRGEELNDGDVLAVDGQVAIVIAAADEDVLELRPTNGRQWGIAAYQLGNLHRPARFGSEVILTPYEPSTEAALQALSVPCQRTRRPLVGERVRAAGGHGHSHA